MGGLAARFGIFSLLAALVGLLLAASPAAAQQAGVQTAWQLLDYMSVDYAGAVSDGKIVSQSEYAEMREFARSVRQRIAALPPNPAKAELLSKADHFVGAVDQKQSPATVRSLADDLGTALLKAYPVALGPAQMPDLARGASLFNQTCASCHGEKGDAETPAAAHLNPPPIAFVDRARASQRSPFALYQVINQGLAGTAMASFSSLPAQDRWDLAYYVSRFAYPASLAPEGKKIWESDAGLRKSIPDLAALSSLTEAQLEGRIGPGRAASVLAYLRSNPAALTAGSSPLSLVRTRLQASLQAYKAGDSDKAESLALSAYLDGFEPVEGALATRDAGLLARVETAMGELRAAIGRGENPSQVEARIGTLDGLLDQVDAALAPQQDSAVSTFIGAATILLREGLEALLIVVGMLAFLNKGGRPDMVRPVHYGWSSALVAGAATWLAATTLVSISGATRELTEGFGSILAALVLLFVGVWMHGKGQADEWQRYIRQRMDHALSKGSGWFLFSLAFVAVYRELFETILFYAALSAEGNAAAVFAGALAGAAALAIVAFVMLRFSQKLPVGKFFTYSSALIAVLAVVLAGKGVAALQEAGLVGVAPLNNVPRISMLGIFPTGQVIAAQVAIAIALILGFTWNRYKVASR
ncbi:MAG: cytochrome c/FTR1 family iron permease [Pseudomonadota bacterium]